MPWEHRAVFRRVLIDLKGKGLNSEVPGLSYVFLMLFDVVLIYLGEM